MKKCMKISFKNRFVVKLLLLILAVVLVGSLAGCSFGSNMPFNGDVCFHEMNVTIPTSFIRDSTQSNEDLWLFEKDRYSELIILSRKDITAEASAALDSYAEYLIEQGVDVTRETFLDMDAIFSTYTRDGVFCQEMLFAYNGSFYAIALRGGTTEAFQSLLDTVSISCVEDATPA